MSLALSGCAGNLSALDPAGPYARDVATLWWIMLVGGCLIFAATSAALALAWTRPDIFNAGSARILVVWGGLLLPSLILAALVGSAFALGERLIGASGSAEPLRIEAEGRQWRWEFRYPAANGAATIDTLHIPVGRDIQFSVTSLDVIHSFWIPRPGGKIDAVPGHRNTIVLSVDKPGKYGGVCAEFCGEGHAPMTFAVVAHPADAYDEMLSRAVGREMP